MKKKNLLLAVATTLCVSCAFTGCGSDDKDNSSTTTTAPATTNSAKTETESTTAPADDSVKAADVLGYWEVKDSLVPSYYYIADNQMEVITMGMKMSVEAKITDTTITTNMLGEETTITYVVENDVLKITEDGETTELKKITKYDYEAVVASLESAENDEDDDENEDPGVNGYVVQPGVTMTITEDDGTVVVYANDGDGTYIKSTTPPSDNTEESTEE